MNSTTTGSARGESSSGSIRRPDAGTITTWLRDWEDGDRRAFDQVMSQIADELRTIASRVRRHGAVSDTLPPTALVNELYLRLAPGVRASFESRAEFFGFAAHVIKLILVDWARNRSARKRGGDVVHTSLDDAPTLPGDQPDVDVLALDQALEELGALDPRQRKVAELRYFIGLSLEEVAETLEVSRATVARDWAAAKAFLYSRLRGPAGTARS